MKSIIFTGESIRAILEDEKTETRRLLKFRKYWNPTEILLHPGGGWFAHDGIPGTYRPLQSKGFMCSYGKVGDKLWVRETFCILGKIYYRADENTNYLNPILNGKWKPSIFMPKKYSRITIEITNLRIEKLQDITIDAYGIKKEGIRIGNITNIMPHRGSDRDTVSERYLELFISFWDSINKKKGFDWEANPWVYVIGFRRMK